MIAPNAAKQIRYGFTLIELVVTLAIISILASLSLAALAGARQKSKVDKTKSTIRKLHEIVLPQYESYANRRATIPASLTGSPAMRKLKAKRELMIQELPDQWLDVTTAVPPVTSAARRYASIKTNVTGIPATPTILSSAECLFMIVTQGGFAADALEFFRGDEIIDINNNNAAEFADGWGRPIAFIRWPAGFLSPIQVLDATINPDPFDPTGVSGDWGVIPLIFSGGPDESYNDPLTGGNGYGITTWGPWLDSDPDKLNKNLASTRQGSPLVGTPDVAAADNITNHDLASKR